jgi:inhibitor of cysteine peptidase
MADIVATEADHAKSLKARVGDTIVLRLQESPTTGYRWAISRGTPENDEFVLESNAIGAGGIRVFRFPMQAPGAVTLELALARAWEDQPPAKHFKVEVQVIASGLP